MHRHALFECSAFDEILKYVNDLSQHIAVPEVIQRAETLYYVFRDLFNLHAPADLTRTLDQKHGLDLLFAQITGIPPSNDLILEESKLKMDDQDWNQLVQIFY